MSIYQWKYTQFAQFNSTDTMLLVSGIHSDDSSTLGEIAVFTLQRECLFAVCIIQQLVIRCKHPIF